MLRFDLNPPDDRPTRMERAWIAIKNWFGRGDLPPYRDLGPANGKGYSEVSKALGGVKASEVRVNERGEEARMRAAEWLEEFRAHLSEAGLGHISEIFDAEAPHRPRGCVAQAWSVAEVLRSAAEDVYATRAQTAETAL